jgi:hypothetical protein
MTCVCPVCGYPGLAEPPRRRRGSGSYEICPSCGFQFGVSDDDHGHTHKSWRTTWKKSGMKWAARRRPPPPGWNPQTQLAGAAPADSTPARKPPSGKPARQHGPGQAVKTPPI